MCLCEFSVGMKCYICECCTGCHIVLDRDISRVYHISAMYVRTTVLIDQSKCPSCMDIILWDCWERV